MEPPSARHVRLNMPSDNRAPSGVSFYLKMSLNFNLEMSLIYCTRHLFSYATVANDMLYGMLLNQPYILVQFVAKFSIINGDVNLCKLDG